MADMGSENVAEILAAVFSMPYEGRFSIRRKRDGRRLNVLGLHWVGVSRKRAGCQVRGRVQGRAATKRAVQ